MTARTVARADAVFEAVLGLVLLVGALGGVLDSEDFPGLGTAVLVAVGLALVPLACVIWTGRIGLASLAAGNSVTSATGLIWLVAGSGFSTAGALIVAVTVVGLGVLAVVQVVTLRA